MKHSIQIMGARAIAVLLCAGVLLTLAGCGGKDGHSSASASAPAPSTSTPAQSSTGQPAQRSPSTTATKTQNTFSPRR